MPQHAKLRFVVDTNIWVSYLLTGSFGALLRCWRTERFQLLYSEELLSELGDVLRRPRLTKRIGSAAADALLRAIQDNAALVEVISTVDVCRDEKDNYLLALCKDGAADLLVTGDDDLLVLGAFGRTVILSPSAFNAAFK